MDRNVSHFFNTIVIFYKVVAELPNNLIGQCVGKSIFSTFQQIPVLCLYISIKSPVD